LWHGSILFETIRLVNSRVYQSAGDKVTLRQRAVAVQFEKLKDRHPDPRQRSKRFLQLASRGEGPCVTEMSNCTTTQRAVAGVMDTLKISK